jgi:hypothetical protein
MVRWAGLGDASSAHRMDRRRRKERSTMHRYTLALANDQLETLRAEAATRRSFRVERPGLRSRIAAAGATMRAAFAVPGDPAPGLPSLSGYPYRG